MLDQIAQLEKDEATATAGFNFTMSKNKKGGKAGAAGVTAPGGATSAQIELEEEQTQEEIISNVEKMIKAEKEQAKQTAKGGAKLVTFDMNEGLVGQVGKKANLESHEGEVEGFGELDDGISELTRKTMAVKAGTMNEMFMENITAITESVNTFQQMEEETIHNDPALLYARQKEEYEREVEKLKVRVEKQTAQQQELSTVAATITQELAQLEYEK